MAKLTRKHRKTTSSSFYEAMPVVSIHTATVPDFAVQWAEFSRTIQEMRDLLAPKVRPAVAKIYLRLRSTVFATMQYARAYFHQAFIAGFYAFETTATYTPSIAADFSEYARWARNRFFSKRATALYLVIAAGATSSIVVAAGITATATLKAYTHDISSPAALLAKKKTGTTILDRKGEVLFQGYGAQPSSVISLRDMPIALKSATLAAEDPQFYDHPGFSWRGTIRAAFTDITRQSRAEGGSTLTQQLVKNALLTTDKNFERKFKEILLATELEKQYSKDQILEMYMNETYYGQGSSGVEAASQTYFHKPAAQLSLGESALLAGLPLGPSRFDPTADTEAATGRRNYVLSRLQEFGKITPAQAALAKAQAITVAGTPASSDATLNVYARTVTIKAPHFVFYVLNQLRDQYGSDLVENGGITVHTTLDLSKQNLAQSIIRMQIDKLAYNHVTNGGLISIEPSTGDIVAMVGSVDYNAPEFGNVNVTLSDLQPGSSFKPIAYATAFKKGWSGATTVQDTPLSVPSGDGTMYTPQNYDMKFHGTVTLRKALDNSLNIPAVKVLQFAGIPETIKTAHDLGITTLSRPNSYGLSLVLGGGEVRPIDMATVYATFANAGTRIEPRSILKVINRDAQDITKTDHRKTEAVLDPRIAYMITHIISDNASRAPEFPLNSPLKLSRPAAAKTGTTNDFRDNWTVGYTPQLVTAVWVGNNDHTAMNNVDGITGAAPIWHDYMEGALQGTPPTEFAVPSGITLARVCLTDGGLANPWDASIVEAFKTDALPTKQCVSAPPKPTPPPTQAPDPNADQAPDKPANQPDPIILPDARLIPVQRGRAILPNPFN